MAKKLNLNSDLGESFGAWKMAGDDAMLRIVNSANVACGYHAGDPLVMIKTAGLAKDHGVSIGAHPSFPDLQGFGRRRMDVPAPELEAMLIYQIGALEACAQAQGTKVTHVKPHGALSNIACADRKVADAVVRAVHRLDPALILLAPAASQMAIAGKEIGLPVIEEVFADRAYLDDGNLVPRSRPDAMVHGAEASLAHVMRMVEESALVSVTGKRIPVNPQSICVHGDNADAVATAQALRDGLVKAGFSLVTIPEL
ncbi:5-oxoprolinase subunit PxpA [Xanthobacteraceae bacterium Astr-EGSB]|uniref:LamB/YcsF family protein n=1 Tax=Astrobacterium formosum TaxID=3069710 RepID=UPI0027B1F7B5|nr:5-oxoprolinase subunit PxpA [Xanthobacteraceae bacterium Astr-EGSB]